MHDDARQETRWVPLLITAAPHVLTVISVTVWVGWWSGKIEERLSALERDRDRDAQAQAAMKADIQRELSGLSVAIQSIDGKLTALLMAQRTGAGR